MTEHPDRPVDANHALLVGAMAGGLMHAQAEGFQYEVRILDDEEGNHLAVFEVVAPSGLYRVRVEKVKVGDAAT